jgi:hypothetical protein
VTRLPRRCCEDPEPDRGQGTVTPFARDSRRGGRGVHRHGLPDSGTGRAQPDGDERPPDADPRLPLIPPGLNEGFGLW